MFRHSSPLTPGLTTPPPLLSILLDKAIPALALDLATSRAHLLADLNRALGVVGEDKVDLLKRQVGRLRIAEVDERHEGEVERHEDQVGLPLQAVDDDGRDHHHEEVPQPVGGDADCGAFGAHVEGEDFGDVAPWDWRALSGFVAIMEGEKGVG